MSPKKLRLTLLPSLASLQEALKRNDLPSNYCQALPPNRETCRRETGGQGSACTDGSCRQSHAVRMARPKCVATVLIRIEREGSSWAGASAITSGGFGRRSRLRSVSAADGSTRNSCSRKMSRLASKSCSMCSHTACNVFIVPSRGLSPGPPRAELAGPRAPRLQRRDTCAAVRPPPSILGRSRGLSTVLQVCWVRSCTGGAARQEAGPGLGLACGRFVFFGTWRKNVKRRGGERQEPRLVRQDTQN